MNRSRNRGVALFAAIFLVVVLGGIAVSVTLLSSSQQISSAQGLESTRAHYAARARLEREIDEALAAAQGSGCPGGGNQDVHGFTTTLACTAVDNIQEGGDTYDVLQLTVTASRGSRDAGTRVRRQLRVQITRGL